MISHQRVWCPMKILTCHGCNQQLKRKDMKKHKTELCTERLCNCTLKEHGCDETMKPRDLPQHLAKHDRESLSEVGSVLYYL